MKTLCTLLLLLSVNFTMHAQHNGPSLKDKQEIERKAKEAGEKAGKNSFFYYYFRNKLIFLVIGGAILGGGAILFHNGDKSDNKNF